MKKHVLTVFIAASTLLAACSGGGGGNSSNDQSDPSGPGETSSTNAKVKCLQQNLSSLPNDYKKVIELSAKATIKCKANRADIEAFLKKRNA